MVGSAGFADAGEDFGRHPLAERPSLRLVRADGQGVESRLGDDDHHLRPAGSVNFADPLLVVMDVVESAQFPNRAHRKHPWGQAKAGRLFIASGVVRFPNNMIPVMLSS